MMKKVIKIKEAISLLRQPLLNQFSEKHGKGLRLINFCAMKLQLLEFRK